MKKKTIMAVPAACFFCVAAVCVLGIILGSAFDFQINEGLANVTTVGSYFAAFGCYFSYCLYPAAGMCLYKGLKKKGLPRAGTLLLITGWFLAVYYTNSYSGAKVRALLQYTAGESSPWLSVLSWLIIGLLYVWPMLVCSKALDEKDADKLIAVGAAILAAGVLADNVNLWLKQVASRPRYKYLITLDDPVSEYRNWWQMVPNLAGSNDSFKSWPSGNMTIASMMFSLPMLADLSKKRSDAKNMICFVIAAVFVVIYGYNRIHMTNHFLTDVCFGTLITYLIYSAVSNAFMKKNQEEKPEGKEQMKQNTSPKALRGLLIAVSLLLVGVLVVQCLFWAGMIGKKTESQTAAPVTVSTGVGSLSREGYALVQTVVLSRHNIRSPLSGSGSALGTITPHEWFQWSSNPSELSLRGGVLETEMGQYFRKWLESESLFPENYHPTEDEVRIYANSKQRTIATAEYFVSGLLPTANTPIETHVEYDTMDPVFTPQLTFVSPEYNADAEAQVWELYGDTVAALADNYALLADVIDMEQSEAWKDGSVTAFVTDDSQLVLELNKEPGVKGSLKTACSVSDALVLQYFEESDDARAAFGHTLTEEQWKQISEVKDVYGDVLFTAPLIAANVAHPLLQEIASELTTDGRTFTFLCGHDSNVGSVLAALGAEDYELPGAIEKTPIGCKLVFSRWHGADGNSYCTVDLVYETVEQLRAAPLLDLEQHPAVVPMRFAGITTNADGLYAEADFMNLLRSSIAEYDRIMETYEVAVASPTVEETKALSLWNDGTGARDQLFAYVSAVTEAGGADYIPVEDRIAVFDMDGTLACETFYTYYDTMMFIEYCLNDHPERVTDELKEVAASIQPGYVADETLARNFAKAYAGMTVEEFYQYAVEFGQKQTASFNNMRYIDNFYLPMVELVEYLYENGFEIWVISGTERTTTRAIVANSPIKDYVLPEHVIGTDFEVKLRGHEDEASNMNFKYENGDELVLTGGFIQKNLNANKSIYVEREIGKRPVLAFGNSGSDTSMMNYALDGRNPYKAQAYMIVADDNVREWGTQDWATKSADYIAKGFIPISMKDDFAVIYPDGITKAEKQYTPADIEEELDQAA